MTTLPLILEIRGTRIELISINVFYSAPKGDVVHTISTVLPFFDQGPNFNIN